MYGQVNSATACKMPQKLFMERENIYCVNVWDCFIEYSLIRPSL